MSDLTTIPHPSQETNPAESPPLVIYHDPCMDGFTAAWVLWKHHGGNIEPVGRPAGEPLAAELLAQASGRVVWVVDLSFQPEEMELLRQISAELWVCDHHETAVKSLRLWLQGLTPKERARVALEIGKSGARLTWEMLQGASLGTAPPKLVAYTEDRDLWRWKLPNSSEVNEWIAAFLMYFETWDMIAEVLESRKRMSSIVMEGETLLHAKAKRVIAAVVRATKVQFGPHEVLAVNATSDLSEVAGALAEHSPFGIAWFELADGRIKLSLRSRKGGVNVAEVAQRLGGGGHAEAAGVTLSFASFVAAMRPKQVGAIHFLWVNWDRCVKCRAWVDTEGTPEKPAWYSDINAGTFLCPLCAPPLEEQKRIMAEMEGGEA